MGFDDEPNPVPMTGRPEDRMVIDDVDHTPARATSAATTSANATTPPTDRWAAAGAAVRAAETAQREADVARTEALKPRSTKAETDAAWDKAMAAQKNAAAAGTSANAAIDEARKNDPPRTQEKPGTSGAVARTAVEALLQAEHDKLEAEHPYLDALLAAKAEAKAADAALIAATEEVGAAQADAKAAHAAKTTARENKAWSKWRTAIYDRKWTHAKWKVAEASWEEVDKIDIDEVWRLRETLSASVAADHPHTQERPGTGTPPEQPGWRTPSEGTHSASLQRDAPTETSPSNQPTAEQLRRAAQLYPADSGQGGIFVPMPQAPTAPLTATVPVVSRTVQPQTPSTRTAAQVPTATPASTVVPGTTTAPTKPDPSQPVSAITTPAPTAAASGFGGNWSGDGGCGFTTLTINDQGGSLLLQGMPGNSAVQATSDGTTAHAQGVVMYAQLNHQLTLRLSGNQLTFQAASATGSCSESFRRQ
jgi:hypothetical protein